MIPVTSLRAGTTFEDNGDLFEVITYNNVHLRKTSSVVKVKIRSLRKGMTIEKSYVSNAKVSPVAIEKRDLQFLYKDNDNCYFMAPQTFEQVSIPLKNLDGYIYLKDGQSISIKFYGNEALGMDIAPKIKLRVTDTTPGVRGNSATNVYKSATLENGMQTKVPLFISIGDEIIVDTRDGSYTSRV
jgi:elongation factor P